MKPDFRDIWQHFLKGEKAKDKGEDREAAKSEKEYFLENLEKYLPDNIQKYDEPVKANADRRRKKKKNPCSILDLHGKTSEEAISILEGFLKNARSRGLSIVLVIVGKGKHSEEGKGILNELVHNWLRKSGSRYICSFEKAPTRLGGEGAILIKLRHG